MRLRDFLNYIEQGKFHRLECLITTETLLEKKLIDAVHNTLGQIEVNTFYGSESDVSNILDSLYQTDLFSSQKLLVIKEFEQLKWDNDSMEAFIKACSDIHFEHYLIMCVADLKKVPKQLNQFIQDNAHVLEIKAVYPNEMHDYITHYVRQLGKKIEKQAVELLVEQIGTDLQEFHSQIDKILLFTPDKDIITRSDVMEQVSMTSHHSVFQLVDALMAADRTYALKIAQNMLASGQHPLMLLSILIKQFQQLQLFIILKQKGTPISEIKKLFGLRDFQINKLDKFSYVFTSKQVGRMIHRLQNLDKELKMRQLPSSYLENVFIKYILTILHESKN